MSASRFPVLIPSTIDFSSCSGVSLDIHPRNAVDEEVGWTGFDQRKVNVIDRKSIVTSAA
jgi:hypothetical protein